MPILEYFVSLLPMARLLPKRNLSTATRTAGALKRQSSFVQWTSGSSLLIRTVIELVPWNLSKMSISSLTGGGIVFAQLWRIVPIGASVASAHGASLFRRSTMKMEAPTWMPTSFGQFLRKWQWLELTFGSKRPPPKSSTAFPYPATGRVPKNSHAATTRSMFGSTPAPVTVQFYKKDLT